MRKLFYFSINVIFNKLQKYLIANNIRQISFYSLISICFSLLRINAQDPCISLWPDTSWNYSSWNPNTATVQGCSFYIDYKYRQCFIGGDTIREIELTGIRFISGCANVSAETIMNEAIRNLLWISSEIFKIAHPAFGWSVLIRTPMCWEKDTDEVKSCDQEKCCSTYYELRHRDWFVEATSQSGLYPGDDCTPIGGCEKRCDAHEVEEDVPLVVYNPYEICLGDCQDVPFTVGANQYADYSGQDCDIRVYYLQRECDGVFEFFLHYIMVWDDGNLNSNQLFNKAIRACLAKFISEGKTTVILRTTSCWHQIPSPPNMGTCNYENCCVTRYNLSNTPFPNCTGKTSLADPEVDCDEPCFNLCNETMNITLSTQLPKMASFEIINIEKNDSYVIPNPVKGSMEIHYKSDLNGNFNLKIFDILGNEIYSKVINKDSEKIEYKINVNEFSNGIYTYKIIFNSRVIESSKFIIKH